MPPTLRACEPTKISAVPTIAAATADLDGAGPANRSKHRGQSTREERHASAPARPSRGVKPPRTSRPRLPQDALNRAGVDQEGRAPREADGRNRVSARD